LQWLFDDTSSHDRHFLLHPDRHGNVGDGG
jgi:hypothetical protein